MKQLHNHSLHTDINKLLNQLDTKLDQMDQLRNAIVELVSNQESFTGATGNSIRIYYQNIHLPFISFYCVSLENYKSSLRKLRETSLDLEEDKNGVIMQKFLEGELTDSLDRTKRKAIDLVDEANSTFSSISDIVHISNLNADDFTSSMDEAQKATDDTIEDLFDFDSKNSEGLETVGDDIQLMEQYVAEMESMVKDGTLSVENYTPLQSNLSLAHSVIIKSLESRSVTNKSFSAEAQLEELLQLYMKRTELTSHNIYTGEKGLAGTSFGFCEIEKEESPLLYETEIEDGIDDGVGNVKSKLEFNDKRNIFSGSLSASIVDTTKMEMGKDALKTKVLYSDLNLDVPYGNTSQLEYLLLGKNQGIKGEVGIGQIDISHEKSPLGATIKLPHADAKTNIENYTISAGASASVLKFEFKLEPFNLFGYDALEEWFGVEEDPYLGFDLIIGGAGIGGSVGTETGFFIAGGIGFGGKIGVEQDED
ncbi:LXG domain-containing protein [Terribacillus sp. FSL K6-0262]|uniref:LXG domain-containing protein n=1 Tax=Terribacillus sp. FSL K6-0262 TaxID=2921447 RepID=UPI0030EFA3E0